MYLELALAFLRLLCFPLPKGFTDLDILDFDMLFDFDILFDQTLLVDIVDWALVFDDSRSWSCGYNTFCRCRTRLMYLPMHQLPFGMHPLDGFWNRFHICKLEDN